MKEPICRAWDKKAGLMCDVLSINYGDKRVVIQSDMSECYDMKFEDVILMQWIGTVDIKQEKMFEGDIIMHKEKFLYVIKYSEINGWFCGVQPRRKDGNTLQGFYTGGITGQDIRRSEVIGNIYENSDLLEDEKWN